MRSFTVERLASEVDGRVEGDPSVEISGVGAVGRAGPAQITYLVNDRLCRRLSESRPGAALVSETFEPESNHITLIRVADPELAFARLLRLFVPDEERPKVVHPTAVVDPSASVAEAVAIGAHAVVGPGVRIGSGTHIGPNVVIEAEVSIGRDCEIGPCASVLRGSVLGDRVTLASGARIGVDGFGYARGPEGAEKILQIGRCVLEDDVDVGANATIDCGAIEDTVVGRGTKIDNLVHIGHNVVIGPHCMIVAQVGIAGSVEVGGGTQLGGQAGISGHLTIGPGARVAAQAGVFGDIPAGETWSGYPARPHRQSLRSSAALGKLPSVLRRIQALEDHVGLEEE